MPIAGIRLKIGRDTTLLVESAKRHFIYLDNGLEFCNLVQVARLKSFALRSGADGCERLEILGPSNAPAKALLRWSLRQQGLPSMRIQWI
jgi:hypothetical protein